MSNEEIIRMAAREAGFEELVVDGVIHYSELENFANLFAAAIAFAAAISKAEGQA